MTDPNKPVPSTDYRIYLDQPAPVEDVCKNPDGYRLLMLFPDDPMDMFSDSLFEQQQWFYSDKEWLFYEDRSGELVRAQNTPENQPGKWRCDTLTRDIKNVAKVIAHRINVSQRRLMEMADRGIPDPEVYSKEEDRLKEWVEKQGIMEQARESVLRHENILHPMVLDSQAQDVMTAIQSEIHRKVVARNKEPELID